MAQERQASAEVVGAMFGEMIQAVDVLDQQGSIFFRALSTLQCGVFFLGLASSQEAI